MPRSIDGILKNRDVLTKMHNYWRENQGKWEISSEKLYKINKNVLIVNFRSHKIVLNGYITI